MDESRKILAEIMLGENNAGVDTNYTLDMYKNKIAEITSSTQLQNEIKTLLEESCAKKDNAGNNPDASYKYDITIMDEEVAANGPKKITRKYIYLIPVGEFNKFLNLIGVHPDFVNSLLESRKVNEKRLGLSSMFGSKKDIRGESVGVYSIGGRKTRRQRKSKRSRKSKRRRYRKTRK